MTKSNRRTSDEPERGDRAYQHDFYDSCGRVRDSESRLQIARKIEFILDNFADIDTEGMTCLDIGCSSGIVTAVVAPRFDIAIGVDIDQRAFSERDRLKAGLAKFVEGDAMRLPFPDATFDCMFCLQVYEHIPDDEALAAEMYRVLKPGGTVLFSGPNLLFPIEPHYHLPFLHWLPQSWADIYLRATGQGHEYYEKSRSYWGLHQLLGDFTIEDISVDVFLYRLHVNRSSQSPEFLPVRILRRLMSILTPLIPNFNWILRKERLDTSEKI